MLSDIVYQWDEGYPMLVFPVPPMMGTQISVADLPVPPMMGKEISEADVPVPPITAMPDLTLVFTLIFDSLNYANPDWRGLSSPVILFISSTFLGGRV